VGERDVCFKVLYCGVCHSDLAVAAAHALTPVQYPLVPGHEAVGVCTKVGAGVTTVRPGDHVGVGPLVDACLECHSCLCGEEQRCARHVPTYNGRDWSGRAAMGGGLAQTAGGYSTVMVVDERFCIRIPPDYPLEHAGPILCAGTTVFDPLKRAGVREGTRLGIVGLGGLGVMGVKLGKALGCIVTVISREAGKRRLAMEAGADRFVVASNAAAMAAHAGCLDVLINTIPSMHDASLFVPLLAPHGRQIHTGGHAAAIAAGTVDALLPTRARERMTYIGSVACTQEVMDLCAREGIRTEIDVRPVTQLNRIFEQLDGANTSGKRFVLDIAGSLDAEVTTAPAPRLRSAPPLVDVCRDIAELVVERLVELSDNDSAGQPVSDKDDAADAPQRPRSPQAPRGSLFALRELLQFDL